MVLRTWVTFNLAILTSLPPKRSGILTEFVFLLSGAQALQTVHGRLDYVALIAASQDFCKNILYPKRFKKEYQIVNVVDLARCEAGEITSQTLLEVGLIKSARIPTKILGNGDVDKPLTIKAAAFSKSAVAKIEAAGGKVEVVKC